MGDTHSRPLAEAPDDGNTTHVSPLGTCDTDIGRSNDVPAQETTTNESDSESESQSESESESDDEPKHTHRSHTTTRPSLVSVASQTSPTGHEKSASAADAPSHTENRYQERWLRCRPDWDTPSDLWITEDTLSMLNHASDTPSPTTAAHAAKIPLPDSPTPCNEMGSTEDASPGPCHAPRPPPSQPGTPSEDSPSLSADGPLCTPRPPADVDGCAGRHANGRVPSSVDLRGACPAVYDDGQMSCSHISAVCCLYEHAMASALPASEALPPSAPSAPSRLFWYYAQREADGATSHDSGGSLRSALNVLRNTGVCSEDVHPFDEKAFAYTPSLDAYEQAWDTPSVACARVEPSTEMLRRTLAAGYPIACSLPVSWAFRTDRVAQTGRIPPLFVTASRSDLGGGHALVLVGYDDEQKVFVVRNSWGRAWGDRGHGYLSYASVQSGRVASAWVMQLV